MSDHGIAAGGGSQPPNDRQPGPLRGRIPTANPQAAAARRRANR